MKDLGLGPCATCASGWRCDAGKIHCGHGVDDDACKTRPQGRNPKWAKLKYSSAGIMAAALGSPLRGSDCEDMDPHSMAPCDCYEYSEAREESNDDQQQPAGSA